MNPPTHEKSYVVRLIQALAAIDALVCGGTSTSSLAMAPEIVLEHVRAYVERSERREQVVDALSKSMGGAG